MKQFVSYGEATYEVGKVYMTGFVKENTVAVERFGYESEDFTLPLTQPSARPVSDEKDRLRRLSPLSVVRNLYKLAKKEQKTVLCALTYEAAHILEDLTTPKSPFAEFQVVDMVKCTSKDFFASSRLKLAREKGAPASKLISDTSQKFSKSFKKAKQHFLDGDVFELVLSRKFCFKTEGKAMAEFLASTMEHKLAPYRFALTFPQTTLVGASPELLVKIEGDQVVTRPISGSIRRSSSDANLNAKEAADFETLLTSEKEKSELDMLIDLARNDLHRICDNVEVKYYREAMILETVVHTQATVVGYLKNGTDAIDALFTCLNAGTLVGAPKKKAMSIISTLEEEPRNFYGGNLIHIFPNGDVRVTILIRTAIIKENVLTLQAGASLLFDSDLNYEYWECGAKAQSLLQEIGHGKLAFSDVKPPLISTVSTIKEPRSGEFGSFESLILKLKLPTYEGSRVSALDKSSTEKVKKNSTKQVEVLNSVASTTSSKKPKKNILLIDNHDSFTFNLCALFQKLGCTLKVVRNNLPMVDIRKYDAMVLSPGPSSPKDAGHLLNYVTAAAGNIPVFGVCLGHQAMVEALGGSLGKLPYPVHGKRRRVKLSSDEPIFEGLPEFVYVARYHSLYAKELTFRLRTIAVDDDNICMAIQGPANWPIFLGLQFHPESFLTGSLGVTLASRFLERIP